MRRVGSVAFTQDLEGLPADHRPIATALESLGIALGARELSLTDHLEGPSSPSAQVTVAGPGSLYARQLLEREGLSLPEGAEAFALVSDRGSDVPAAVAVGTDARGLSYALRELADRVIHSESPLDALSLGSSDVERPANAVRSVARLFVSDAEDKGWFGDRAFWRRYFSMLAGCRFNRFHLALGIGHDFLRDVRDAYFLFPYPFLLDVRGYRVHASGLPDEERNRNLETLRFISEEATAHGLHFQLGLWTHGYRWHDSPRANYTVEGLEQERHAAYCREALCQLLTECPSIAGLTLRVHGESGVPEGSHAFWREVFAGAAGAGRRIELDLHPKGLDRETVALALETGLPVTVSPKYAAEHQGLPYHQAAIRGLERETRPSTGDSFVAGLMSRSGGDLRYTRYSYADFLAEDRPYGVYFRVWPGTRRLLLSGDPAFAAALSRSGSFCGSLGLDVMEPLSMKGRRGSGVARTDDSSAGRLAYADQTLETGWDFEKYEYTYLLLGRHLYNPETEAAVWRRQMPRLFPSAPHDQERALSLASRVLPLFTSAHLPSAANNLYWPEY